MALKTGSTILYTGTTTDSPPKPIRVFQHAHAPHGILTFVSGLTAQAASTTENATPTRAIKAHTRRRYPGGPTISVPALDRKTMGGAPCRRSILPGYTVTLEIPKDGTAYIADGGQKLVSTQVTITGPFTRFYAWCNAHSVKPFLLRSPQGRPYNVFHSA